MSASGDANNPGSYVEAFRQGLRDLGYIEGKNILIEYRYAEAKLGSHPRPCGRARATQGGCPCRREPSSIRAAKQATKTIPIVMVSSVDPVAAGIVDSLARPGGNITGLATLTRDLSGKRLELLKEVVPGIKRVGVLRDTDDSTSSLLLKSMRLRRAALKIQLQSLEVRRPNPPFRGSISNRGQGTRKCAHHDYGIRYSHVTQSRLRTLP